MTCFRLLINKLESQMCIRDRFNEVLNPIDCNFVLSDKQIDEQCEVMSKIISKSINALRY